MKSETLKFDPENYENPLITVFDNSEYEFVDPFSFIQNDNYISKNVLELEDDYLNLAGRKIIEYAQFQPEIQRSKSKRISFLEK